MRRVAIVPAIFCIAVSACLALAACATTADPSPVTTADPSPAESPRSSSSSEAESSAPAPEVDLVEGMYDVGDHKLFMSCAGEGSPTVVYLHGWIDDPSIIPHANGEYIRRELTDHRVCLYDRRNVGSSQTVDAVQTHQDMLRDMERVLEAADVEPPYILMAASFGGMLAYSYLNHHPDNVAGMVLLDASFPDELSLDRYLPRRYRSIAYAKDDACCTPERFALYPMLRDLQRYIGEEPDIPVIYLAAKHQPWNLNDYDSPAYDRRILNAQADYVDRFSPGKLLWVDAPHFMEPIVPDEIAEAVRDVASMARDR